MLLEVSHPGNKDQIPIIAQMPYASDTKLKGLHYDLRVC